MAKVNISFMTALVLDLILALALLNTCIADERDVPVEYVKMQHPFQGKDDKDAYKRGAYLFKSKCAKCHGELGDGKGLLEGIEMPVFNKEFLGKVKDGYIFWRIEQRFPDSLMPSFGDDSDEKLSTSDRWKIVYFVRKEFGK